jgi:hypothetical protein
MTNPTAANPVPEIQVERQGDLPPGIAGQARTEVSALLAGVEQPVLFARIRLSRTRNPATDRPYLAQVSADVNGRPVRAHLAVASADEAVDLVCDRLDQQLARLKDHSAARREGPAPAGEHEWRHGTEPTHRPDWFPRPIEEREVVRHKSFALARETPDEAAFEMDLMDYDFHLFTDLATGEDSVVYRTADTSANGGRGYRLAQVHSRPMPQGPTATPVTVSPLPAPRMDLTAARQRLEALGQPFVFFADATTGRGNVLYHRYDGHYGLITPAE